MRPGLFLLCVLLAYLSPSYLVAEDPSVPWNAADVWSPGDTPAVQPPLPAPVDSLRAVGPQWLDAELFVGLPTEVRLQWAFLRGPHVALMLEGIAGVEVLPFLIGALGFELGGVGGRVRFALYNGERNAIVVKPEDWRRTAEAGFDHHLVKPVEPRTLEGLLADLSCP